MISSQTAYNIYQKNKDATIELLAPYNNGALEINAVITNTYLVPGAPGEVKKVHNLLGF